MQVPMFLFLTRIKTHATSKMASRWRKLSSARLELSERMEEAGCWSGVGSRLLCEAMISLIKVYLHQRGLKNNSEGDFRGWW